MYNAWEQILDGMHPPHDSDFDAADVEDDKGVLVAEASHTVGWSAPAFARASRDFCLASSAFLTWIP